MPTFPPIRTIIGFPYTPSAITVLAGETYSSTYYPVAALMDGLPRLAWRSVYGNVAIRVDLGINRPVNFVGLVGHNIALGTLVTVWASTSSPPPDLPPYPDDEGSWGDDPVLSLGRTFGIEYPNCWVDVRDAAGTAHSARYWQIHINNASGRALAINEVVIGLGEEFEGIIARPYAEELYAFQERQTLEYGKLAVSSAGTMARTLDLELRVSPEEQTRLNTIWETAALGPAEGTRVVVVPDSRRNDLWYVQWPVKRETTYPQSYLFGTVPLTIAEEAFGAV